MKRVGTPNKNRQNQLKNSHLSYMVNALFLSNFNNQQTSFVTSKKPISNVHKQAEQNNNYQSQRPLTSDKRLNILLKNDSNQFNFKSESKDRKSLRPKSSVIGSRQQSSVLNRQSSKQKAKDIERHPKRKPSMQEQEAKTQLQTDYNLATEKQMLFVRVPSKAPKTIVSTKSNGLVRGYGVNSHKFFNNAYEPSEARLLVISNLTKTSKPECIVSLYAIFESNKSSLYVEFLRQNFQAEVAKRLDTFPMPAITKQLIELCFEKVENKFCDFYKINRGANKNFPIKISNNFGISFGLVFAFRSDLAICTKGTTKVSLCSQFGEKMNSIQSAQLQVKTISEAESSKMDFISITGEGIDVNSQGNHWINRKIWFEIMKIVTSVEWLQQQMQNKIESSAPYGMHSLMGTTIDAIMSGFTCSLTSKNYSIVLIGFKNIEQILQVEAGSLILPHMIEGRCENKQSDNTHFQL